MKAYRTLLPYLKRYRVALVFGVISVLGANALAPLVAKIIGDAVTLAESGRLNQSGLLTFAGYALSIACLGGAFRFLMRRIIIDVSRHLEYELRNDLFAKLQTLDPSFFDTNNTGDLMSRTTNDMDMIRMLIGPAVMYSANTIFSLPLTLTWMLLLDWKLTLMAVAPMAILPPLVKRFGASMHTISRLQQDRFGKLSTMVQENLAGIRVVKAYRQEASEEAKFQTENDEYIDASLKLADVQSMFFPSVHFIISLGYIALLGFGGYSIAQGTLEVGTLVSFLLLFGMLIWPMIAAGWVINMIQRGLASLERIGMIFQAEPKVRSTADDADLPQSTDITIRNLTFQYEATPSPQLSGVSLDVPEGKVVGIVGPVGSGKSTLVQLLARFYPVERGMIEIGGKDINDWPLDALRQRVAFVFQETFLFSDTIGWNVRFGAHDDMELQNVIDVSRMSQVHGDIDEFPGKYDTVLGERGVNLSGGQKQRVSIARALLRDARVLVLDDSLSAVDTHTEEAILRELKTVFADRTCFIISHRISTVAMADEIIVLEEGRITQRGRHDELIRQAGLYAELNRKQQTERQIDEFDEERGLAQ